MSLFCRYWRSFYDIAFLHTRRKEYKQAEREPSKALKIYERLAKTNPERYATPHVGQEYSSKLISGQISFRQSKTVGIMVTGNALRYGRYAICLMAFFGMLQQIDMILVSGPQEPYMNRKATMSPSSMVALKR